ncbi:MAG: FixH family protein [Gammaproteobacteria bacterium]
MNNQKPKRPWYREPWVWLIIALPMTAVIASMFTIYKAVSTADGLVVDDYYKRGKAINMDLARDAAALRYQFKASIDFDLRDNRVQILLESAAGDLPATLNFALLHPTQAGYDQVLVLQHGGDGVYTGAIDEVGRGNWYLQLEADDWRLSGSMRIPQTETTVLLPMDVAG